MLKFILATLLFGFVTSKTNFCDPNLCPSGSKHIACGNYGIFAKTCPADRTIVKFMLKDMKLIVALHNKLRNRIASGAEVGFKSASRMATMTWNTELEELAKLNVKQCKMQHDACRSTDEFRLAGQNLAIRSTFGDPETLEVFIEKVITDWYDESKNAQQSDIDNCCKSASGKTIGHFTQLVTDRATKVGCAITRYSEGTWTNTLIACNYAFTNLNRAKVYTSGAPASSCTLGPNPDYPALCNIKEPIKPTF